MQLRYNQPDWQPLTRAAIPCKIPSNLHFHTLCRGHFCICRRDFCRRMIRDGCRLGAGRVLFGGFAMVAWCTQHRGSMGPLWIVQNRDPTSAKSFSAFGRGPGSLLVIFHALAGLRTFQVSTFQIIRRVTSVTSCLRIKISPQQQVC